MMGRQTTKFGSAAGAGSSLPRTSCLFLGVLGLPSGIMSSPATSGGGTFVSLSLGSLTLSLSMGNGGGRSLGSLVFSFGPLSLSFGGVVSLSLGFRFGLNSFLGSLVPLRSLLFWSLSSLFSFASF